MTQFTLNSWWVNWFYSFFFFFFFFRVNSLPANTEISQDSRVTVTIFHSLRNFTPHRRILINVVEFCSAAESALRSEHRGIIPLRYVVWFGSNYRDGPATKLAVLSRCRVVYLIATVGQWHSDVGGCCASMRLEWSPLLDAASRHSTAWQVAFQAVSVVIWRTCLLLLQTLWAVWTCHVLQQMQ